MSRYIDADALRDKLYEADAVTLRGVAIINNEPTVDAVPVEWIKEQIERLKSQDNVFASLTAGMIDAMLADYCADGERRTDEQQSKG